MKETVFHPSRSEMLSTDSRQKNRILFDAIRGEGVNRRGVCGEIEIDKSVRNRVRRSRFGRDASMNSEMVSSEGRSRNEGCTTRAGRLPSGFRNEKIYRVPSRVVPRLRG